jgi:hypothetical protein
VTAFSASRPPVAAQGGSSLVSHQLPPTTTRSTAYEAQHLSTEQSVIDPELIALDHIFPPVVPADLTLHGHASLQDDYSDLVGSLSPLPDDRPEGRSVLTGKATTTAEVIARQPLILQTAFESHPFPYTACGADASTTTTYPPFSLPGSQTATQDNSPVTPSDNDSLYEPGLTSPLDQSEAGGESDSRLQVPGPRVKKSHARKVREATRLPCDSELIRSSNPKGTSSGRAMPSSYSASISPTRISFRPAWRSSTRTSRS